MFHVIVNANSIVEHVIQIRNEIMKRKNYRKCKKDYSWNPSSYNCENSKNLKSIAHASVIVCYKVICYGCCINKKDKYYSNKYTNKLS